jgi:hypothetical protein
VLETVALDDPRRAQILKVLETHSDKASTLRTELAKVIERDILRTKLTEILGSQFPNIEPLLSQSFTFNWFGETKKFSIQFVKEQKLHLKSLTFKKAEGPLRHLIDAFNWIVEKLLKNRKITLPKEIHGTVDFENAEIKFDKSTFIIGPTHVGLKQITFARENWIDIDFNFFKQWTYHSDTTKSGVDKALIAIVDKTLKARKPQIAAREHPVRDSE